MTSFRETRDFILIHHDQGILKMTKNSWFYASLDLPYNLYPLFHLDDMEDDESLAEFRVKKRDTPALAEALQIPNWISCNQRSKAKGTEALCVVLPKALCLPLPVLCYGTTVRSSCSCMVANEVLDYLCSHGHRIVSWNLAVLKLCPSYLREGHHCRVVLVLLTEQLGLLRGLIY